MNLEDQSLFLTFYQTISCDVLLLYVYVYSCSSESNEQMLYYNDSVYSIVN